MGLPFKPDIETNKVINDGEHLERVVAGQDYQYIKERLLAKVMQLDKYSTIDIEKKSFEQIGQEAVAKAGAVSLVMEVLNEIEADAAQSKATREAMGIKPSEEIISTYEEVK